MKKLSVVLANLMSMNGELNAETSARVDLAAQLENEKESALILLCGWNYRPDCAITIADAMKKYLIENHTIDPRRIDCQRMSRDTVGDAIYSRIYADVLAGDPFQQVNVVTSSYHMDRSREIFEFVFGKNFLVTVSGVPGFESDNSSALEASSLSAFRKTFEKASPGDLTSIFYSLRNYHPYYNGEVFSKIEDLPYISKSLHLQ